MRFVPVKTAEQQAALMLVGVRDRLIRNRTQLSNAIRGYAGEFGLTAAKGKAHLAFLLERIQADESLPALARELFAAQGQEYGQLQAQIVRPRARSGSAGSREPATKHCAARRKAVALAYRTPQTQVAEVGRRGTGQQDGAHRLETDDYGRKLHHKSCAAALADAG